MTAPNSGTGLRATVKLGHITDPHLDGSKRARDRLIRVIDALASHATKIDALVVTGDVVEAGDAAEPEKDYAFAREQAGRLGVPVLWCRGNSDEPTAAGFGGTLQLPGLTVLALDSSTPGSFAGSLSGAEIAAARAAMEADTNRDDPIVLALHHPPVELGHPNVDEIRLVDARPLASLIADEPRIIAILAGHTHAATMTTFQGRPLVLARGVHSDGQLPLEALEPWTDLIDETADPGYAVHLLIGRRLVSYFRTVSPHSPVEKSGRAY